MEKVANVVGLLLAVAAIIGRFYALENQMVETREAVKELKTSLDQTNAITQELKFQLAIIQHASSTSQTFPPTH